MGLYQEKNERIDESLAIQRGICSKIIRKYWNEDNIDPGREDIRAMLFYSEIINFISNS